MLVVDDLMQDTDGGAAPPARAFSTASSAMITPEQKLSALPGTLSWLVHDGPFAAEKLSSLICAFKAVF
jgi:hypothetical protein